MSGPESNPLVSILLPVYNGVHTLGDTLESLLAQNYQRFELLICIDGTRDGSEEVALRFDDPRIKIYRNHSNLGLGPTLNRLVSLTSPEVKYLAMAEQDDYYYPERLQLQVGHLESNPDTGLVSGIAEFFNGEEVSGRFPGLLTRGNNYPQGKDMFLFTYRDQIKVVNSCMMIRKRVHMEHGLYFTSHHPSISVDWTYILRFSLVAKIDGIPKTLVRLDRRNSRNSVTKNKTKQFAAARELIDNFRYEQPELVKPEDYRYAMTTQHLLELGHANKWKVLPAFVKAFFKNPGDKRFLHFARKKFLRI